MKANPTCRKCGVALDSENWYKYQRETNRRICKGCKTKQERLWQKANPEKRKVMWTRAHRKEGKQPFDKNKECTQYLGIHVAERVLSRVFKDVKRMPVNNPGYDVICNRNKLIDIKSSCQRKNGTWQFGIKRNSTADFFLCLAFNNRKDLTPLYIWLLPGNKFSHLKNAVIRQSTIHKWDEYKLDITKVLDCCDTIRGEKG